MIWFTSDTHFFHKNIIQYCARPFGDVQHMNDVMMDNWNECVKPTDKIYFLGDFAFASQKVAIDLLTHLNGVKVLVKGNHDKGLTKDRVFCGMFDDVRDYYETKELLIYEDDEGNIKEHQQPIILFHYPIDSWNGKAHGSWHLHGHTHGTSHKMKNRLDVGVDSHQFLPWSMDDLTNHFALEQL